LTKKGSSVTERKIFTYDKAKEFCGHQELSQKLGADFYFATPYHSWERGLNGLFRTCHVKLKKKQTIIADQ
jgi:IS30 family transposase